MKTLTYLVLCLALCLVTPAFAEVDLSIEDLDLPDVKAGAVYCFESDDIEFATCATLLTYEIPKVKLKLDVDAMYGIDNMVGGGIALDLGSLKELAGVELALAKYIDLSIGGGYLYDFNAEEGSWCIYGTAVKIKF